MIQKAFSNKKKIRIIILFVSILLALPSTTATTEINIDHLSTPETVKAIFITLPTALNSKRMEEITDLTKRTEINSFIIDIRSNGRSILFRDDPETKNFLTKLHQKDIYLIARVTVFKAGWKSWHDPSDEQHWEKIAIASRHAISLGFDEINYDYVRYGAVNEPQSNTPLSERRNIINSFFQFLKREVRTRTGHPISLDIFGSTFISPQFSIGQILEDAVQNFDYIMPMPYPSHWRIGSFGLDNPAHHPYQTIFKSLTIGWNKVKDDPNCIAKLRPWIQAFHLDSSSPMKYYKYTHWHVYEQIRAAYDSGSSGWALWNARNRYEEFKINQSKIKD